MKSSFCSFVPSHSPAVSLLSNKVHSECHNATDPFLDWYLFICLFISESLLLIDFTTIPCFLLCFKTPYFPCSFVPNFFYEVHIWLSLAFFFFCVGLFLRVHFLLPAPRSTAVALLWLTIGPGRKGK